MRFRTLPLIMMHWITFVARHCAGILTVTEIHCICIYATLISLILDKWTSVWALDLVGHQMQIGVDVTLPPGHVNASTLTLIRSCVTWIGRPVYVCPHLISNKTKESRQVREMIQTSKFKLTNDSCLKIVWGIFVGGALCGGALVAVPLWRCLCGGAFVTVEDD